MNWIDTPLLVYGVVSGHPARETVARELRSGSWGSTVLTLLELYHVLVRDYAVAPQDAARAVERFTRSPIRWAELDL